MKTILPVFLLITLLSTLSIADIINVPADIDSIQGGINLASDGDTVLVDVGTYYENINFNGKNIVVGSLMLTTGDNSYISQTMIDGSQPSNPDSGSVVYFISGEDTTTVLSGFTITGGIGTFFGGQAHGGGIFMNNNSCPDLLNLIVTGNVAESANGAGICCRNNSNCRMKNVIVTENDGSGDEPTNDGSAGIILYDSSPMMRNVSVVNNIGLMAGGLYISDYSYPVLINVTIANNNVRGSEWFDEVAEIVIYGFANPLLINAIVWGDSLRAILQREESAITIAYSDIQGGLDSIHTIQNDTTYWLDNNINADPMFVDTANGDYRLIKGSPCIDKGIQDIMIVYNDGRDTVYIPSMDYIGTAPDMGAYEFGDPTKIEEQIDFPKRYTLSQNYPNPFNPSTTIEFSLPKSEYVELKVYNILGKEVATLVSNKLNQGNHTYTFDGKNLASGVYYYQLVVGDFHQVKKMILIK